MGKRKQPTPTDTELEILDVLRRRGPSTVRQVLDEIRGQRKGETVGYTTVLKMLQVMLAKGLVDRDASKRSHTYRAIHQADKAIDQMVQRVVDRYFGGSLAHLFARAATSEMLTDDELEKIEEIIEQMRKGRS